MRDGVGKRKSVEFPGDFSGRQRGPGTVPGIAELRRRPGDRMLENAGPMRPAMDGALRGAR